MIYIIYNIYNNIYMIISLKDYSNEYRELFEKYKFKKKYKKNNIIEEYINNSDIHLQLNDNTVDVFEKNNYASTYGELTLNGMKTILNKIKNNQRSYLDMNNIRFIDLGSGLGKLPLIMSYYFNAKKSTGVELSVERHNKAMSMYNKLDKELQQRINYINDDLFKVDLSDYNFIFISNLCFPTELNKRLIEKLKECKKGTNILCSKPFEAPHLRFIDKFPVEMTWSDNSTIHHYIKN
jgi:predicted nicotinamide N-methyase